MLKEFFPFNEKALALDQQVMALCQPEFAKLEQIRDYNQLKMLSAFTECNMAATELFGSTGYGLWDPGRDKLEIGRASCRERV